MGRTRPAGDGGVAKAEAVTDRIASGEVGFSFFGLRASFVLRNCPLAMRASHGGDPAATDLGG